MTSMRPFALALLGVLTIAVIAPVHAQNTKPAKTRQAKPDRTRRDMDRQTTMPSSGMSSTTMAPAPGNNTAAVQTNIQNANKTLSDMVALLDSIEARKKNP